MNHFNYNDRRPSHLEDDDTYLCMDQYKERDGDFQHSAIPTQLGNILLRSSNQTHTSAGMNKNHHGKFGGYNGRSNDNPTPPVPRRPTSQDGCNSPFPGSSAGGRNIPNRSNYTKWNPALKTGSRPLPGPVGTPGIKQPVPPPRPDLSSEGDMGPAQDNEEDYLTFESDHSHNPPFSSGPPYHPSGFPSAKPTDRPQLPAPMPLPGDHSAPHIPPRSPRHGGDYNDHVLPPRPASDIPPDRPPPLPPGHQSATVHQPWKRGGSGKDSVGNSPASSREPSLKNDHVSHTPSRKFNSSVGSNSSTSSEDGGMPPPIPGSFRPMKGSSGFGNIFPPRPGPKSVLAMPPVVQPPMPQTQGLEDQPWYRDKTRNEAQEEVSACREVGCFVVRPRDSPAKPYALTLWANDKIYNFIIRKRGDGEFALGNEKSGERTFPSVMKLVDYYQQYDLVLAEMEGVVKLTRPPN